MGIEKFVEYLKARPIVYMHQFNNDKYVWQKEWEEIVAAIKNLVQ